MEFTGEIYDKKTLTKYYEESKYIVLCSVTEGLPMVILEAMAYGVIPICVDVGELHSVINSSNGVLIPNSKDDKHLEEEISRKIKLLESKDLNQLNQISYNAHQTYHRKYSKNIFCNKYRDIILND